MSSFRKLFKNRNDAQQWCADAIAALNVRYKAWNAEANPGLPASAAITALSSRHTILAVEPIAMPMLPGQVEHSRVKVLIESVTGTKKISHIQCETQSLPLPARMGGYAHVAKTDGASAEFRARLPSHVQFNTIAAATVGSGVQLVDPRSSKVYQTTASATGAGTSEAGLAGVLIAEVDSSQPGDVTYGSQLRWVSRPPKCTSTATVDGMAGTGTPQGPVLVDPGGSGALYDVLTGVQLNGNDGGGDPLIATSGYLSTTVPVVQRAPAAGSGVPTDLLTVGASLPFYAPIASLVSTGIVRSIFRPLIPGGLSMTFNDSAGGVYPFETSVDTQTDDLATIIIPFRYLRDGAGPAAPISGAPPPYQFVPGSGLTIAFPPSGVNSGAIVDSIVGAQSYPLPWRTSSRGAAVTWNQTVQRETNGQWSAQIFTAPAGI